MSSLSPSINMPNNFINDFLTDSVTSNPLIIMIIIIILLMYYYVLSQLNVGKIGDTVIDNVSDIGAASMSGKSSLSAIEILFWGLLVFLVVINGVQLFFSIDLKTEMRNLIWGRPELDITVNSSQLPKATRRSIRKEVFHIPENTYTFKDAKAVCKAFDAELADYNQVEKAYREGGEWCSYGWSKDQLALFPTQSSTFQKLQDTPGLKHSCGRPGVNGGFIANPNVRFGVNCYGYKPVKTNAEATRMNLTGPIPTTRRQQELDRRVAEFRKSLSDIMLSPFNYMQWNR